MTGVRVYEEVELIDMLPTVPQYSSCKYTLPALNSKYPDALDVNTELKVHFAVCPMTIDVNASRSVIGSGTSLLRTSSC